jgi:hypothetical protein
VKAPKGLGWITDPKRALYNRIYSRTTRGCMLYVIIFLGTIVVAIVGCDVKPMKERAKRPVYVSPSVDYRGRIRNGHFRRPVSRDKNAIRNQGKSKYYYETRGKYHRK